MSASPKSTLLLDVDDDDAQGRHQSQSLDAQEPEQEPEEEHDHRLHYSVPKQHVAESQPAQTLIEHPEQSSHPLAVIQPGFGSGFFRCASPGAGTAAGGESLSDAIELRKKHKHAELKLQRHTKNVNTLLVRSCHQIQQR